MLRCSQDEAGPFGSAFFVRPALQSTGQFRNVSENLVSFILNRVRSRDIYDG